MFDNSLPIWKQCAVLVLISAGWSDGQWTQFMATCFLVNRTNVSQQRAQTTCSQHGGALVTVDSLDEHRYITNYLIKNASHQYWVGLTYTNGRYLWSNGKTLNLPIWNNGEPNHSGRCVRYKQNRGSDAKLADHPCGNKYSFICEKPAEMASVSATKFAGNVAWYCEYRALTTPRSRLECAAVCSASPGCRLFAHEEGKCHLLRLSFQSCARPPADWRLIKISQSCDD